MKKPLLGCVLGYHLDRYTGNGPGAEGSELVVRTLYWTLALLDDVTFA
jgi:hypothetical protein